MRLIYHPDAETEVIEAARFYEEKAPALGMAFLADIDVAAEAISGAPERWPILTGDIRRYLVVRFPYAVLYRVLPDHLRVLAVKHHRRHPDYWRGRLVD